ncbi:MAG TPA: hypothetical protein VIO61_00075 [Anaerolineaceae bacterium]
MIENNPNRPHFELRQVAGDGQPSPVEVYNLDDLPALAPALHLKRRDLLTLAGLTSGVLFSAACAGLALPAAQTPTPVPTATPAKTATPAATATRTIPPPTLRPSPANSQTAEAERVRSQSCTGLSAATGRVGGAFYSPDGKWIWSSEVNGPLVRLWNAETGELVRTFNLLTYSSSMIFFSQDSSLLYAANQEGLVFIWQVSDGKEIARLDTKISGTKSVMLSSDKRLLAVNDTTRIQVWDIAKGTKVTEINGNFSSYSILSPDDRYIASADSTNSIVLYRFPGLTPERSLKGATSMPIWLAFSPDSADLAASFLGSKTEIRTWLVSDGSPRWTLPTESAWWVGYSQDGKTLVGNGLSLLFWSNADGKLQRTITLDKEWEFSQVSPSLTRLTRVKDNRISLWDIQDKPASLGICLFDKDASSKDASANTYKLTDSTGVTRTYTLPCGAPIPAGAICTCNCIPGTGLLPTAKPPTATLPSCSCVSYSSGGGGGGYCSCNKICTCIPVRKYCFVMIKPEDAAHDPGANHA